MKKVLKELTALTLIVIMSLFVVTGCGRKKAVEGPVVNTIYIGHHYVPEIDPYWVSEITGEPGMAPGRRKAAIAALDKVKEELGVELKWKQWPNGATRDCLQTVLAGDPFCHMAVLSGSAQATVLTQNVLQPLDPYLEAFNHPDAEWIVMPPVFGHHYFMERDLIFVTDWPMVFNANMIDAVPELKDENGDTIYPYDLYREGKWTWGEFEKYLEKINNFYSGKKSPAGNPIVPFNTNYTYAVQMALHSNGASIYDGNAIEVDSPEAIEACEYLDRLMEKGLVSCSAAVKGENANSGGTGIGDRFRDGESVFTHMARWRMGGASNTMAERGESMGIMFWPRPDDIPFTGEEYVEGASQYEICKPACDAIGLLRGFDHEESMLAVKTYVLYTEELYKNIGGVKSIAEYRESMAPNEALTFGIDIFHPEVGDDNLTVFGLLGRLKANEFCENMGMMWDYGVAIFGDSVYGVGGSPKYAVAVKAKRQNLYNKIENIQNSLKSEDASDTTLPNIVQKITGVIAFEKGTDPKKIDWTQYFGANDNVDGEYEIKQVEGKLLIKPNPPIGNEEEVVDEETGITITRKKELPFVKDRMSVDYTYEYKVNTKTGAVEIRGIDFDSVGVYDKGITVKVTDSQGNMRESIFKVYVYNGENTQMPTLTLKAEADFPVFEKEVTRSEDINWANFAVSAVDAEGVDIKDRVSGDVTELDLTLPGTYPVTIYVTDFNGNRTEVGIMAKVK